VDIADSAAVMEAFAREKPNRVVHLAGQAGVRYSITNPGAYISSNIVGSLNILEGCRHHGVEHLVYASSSSVYGLNSDQPLSVSQSVDHPVSLYAATKKSNELMAHSYSHLYGLPTTGLRFFTVYGPWGRPDMAPFIFTRNILENRPIEVFNMGVHARDFTYVDDIVGGVIRVLDHVATPDKAWSSATPDPGSSSAPWRVYNIGNSQPVELMDFIAAIESACGRTAEKIFLPKQPGDVERTYADMHALERDVGFRPSTPVGEGVARLVAWYRGFYGV
jgi:UDP-glucuronate 4-epimerase